MPLTAYRQKRSLKNTPEPAGGKSRAGTLAFVVQKHKASHLHYDFRLEMKGVLKSWAIPKGPSLDPSVKRLAVMVEDHPYDYKDFEGIIPKGNYGAGSVIIWDEGTYETIDGVTGKTAMEKSLLKQLKEGSLKIRLYGKKLKGEFALVKTKGMEDNAWLLIKHKDRYATASDILLKEKSVVSNKTNTSLEKQKEANVWISRPRKVKADPGSSDDETGRLIEKIKRLPDTKIPSRLAPMLASLIKEPFDDERWHFEIKWDGYRTIAVVHNGKVQLISRNNKSFNGKFSVIYDELLQWKINLVLDGEIVAVDKKGIAHFGALQNWSSQSKERLLYYVFDILWLEGKYLGRLPLKERLTLLHSLPVLQRNDGIIRTGFSVDGRGIDFFEQAKKTGLEGIIAKKLDSIYEQGIRSNAWLKIKIIQTEEAVIVGFTNKKDSPKLFSSLLLAKYKGKTLTYAGRVGTGFTEKQQKELLKVFKPFITQRPPLKEIPDMKGAAPFRYNISSAEITWLKPVLIAQVQYTEITEDGLYRHPSFSGLREDKEAKEVKYDPAVAKQIKPPIQSPVKTKKTTTGSKKAAHPPKEEGSITQKVSGRTLVFTHPDKLYWPEKKITKGMLLDYYHNIASFILPYIKNRPQSMYRFPDGYKGKSFYQKDVKGKVPDWMETLPYKSKDDNEQKEFLVVKDEASLLYMVNYGCIEINPWSSSVKKPENPDWCLLDIDPDKTNTFSQVVEVAQTIHRLLEDAQIPSYPKTSGSTGMHIYIPLGTKYDYDQSREFARIIVTLVQQQLPELTSIERQVNKRKRKVYLDFLQNRQQATLAAPYSVRPKKEATVSMPLHWSEVKEGLRMEDFTLQNVPALLKKRGDIFTPVFGPGINMVQCLKRLDAISKAGK
ncbi:MAG: DNA ligase D [Chitinophagaceae bacterium]|nr:DNA ligase D [Chitinophagaceae bacterium]